MAVSAAAAAFVRTWGNPATAQQADAFTGRQARFARLWSYYSNDAFEDLAAWEAYKGHHQLYREIRSIYNPTRRLVDLYAGLIYPGVLSEDGARLPDGVPLAVPLAKDTDPAIRAAVAQGWQWSNWQMQKAVYVRLGAATGSVLLAIEDDPERGKVSYHPVWPGFVKELELDRAGNPKLVWIEYDVAEGQKVGARTYRYGRRVDQETIRTYRDDREADFGGGAVQPNPYGFVPYRFVAHKALGGVWGAPAIDGSLGKVDELNSLASRVHDAAARKVDFPVVFWADGELNLGSDATAVRDATSQLPVGTVRQELDILQGPAGGRVDTLASTLELGDALKLIESLLAEVQADHPLLRFWDQLREMSDVTGPAALALMGDAVAPVWEAAAGYDENLIRVCQMQMAIAGWRIQRGDWGRPLTRQQAKFAPFDLTSYARGDLDFGITPRALIPPSDKARADVAVQQAAAIKGYVEAGWPLDLATAEVKGWEGEQLAPLRLAMGQQAARSEGDILEPAVNG